MSHYTFPGEQLRQRREELGFSVKQAAEHTHISLQYIEALENVDLINLPPVCYACGFIRTYCSFLGLAPEGFLHSYKSLNRPGRESFRRPSIRELSHSSWMPDFVAWAAVCMIIGLCWVTYQVVFRPTTTPAETRVEAGELVLPSPSAELE